MPSIEYTEIEHYSTTDICNVDIYDHEVHTTFDPSEYKQEVLDAIKFDGSQDLLTWAVREKNMSLDDIFKTLRDKKNGKHEPAHRRRACRSQRHGRNHLGSSKQK